MAQLARTDANLRHHRSNGARGWVRLASLSLTVLALAGWPGRPAQAEEVWSVRSGQAFIYFNVELLRDLGIDVEVHALPVEHPEEVNLEEPAWTFPIQAASNLQFRTRHGIVLAEGSTGGALRLSGTFALKDRASGRVTRFDDPEIADSGPTGTTPGGGGTDPLLLRAAGTGLVFAELRNSMFDFRHQPDIAIHYLNARITESWANAIGRPDLAGWVVGIAEVFGETERLSATPETTPPYVPQFTAGFLDVSLGGLTDIQAVGHAGTFPTGTAALSMATTSCNLGDVDVPWLAPMQENHPLIHMAIYRLLNGRFEQIGVSWMKHGFFALSNNQCTPCQHPSNGDFLGVGCSDTYDVGNNSSRTYLGPRSEVDAYAGTWECTGSHFAGGVQDCTRRHSSTGHGVLDHRLVAADADLNNPGATYYYEAYYVVSGDQKLNNNWGYRRCTMSWNGSTWLFTTPPSPGNPLTAGPALAVWGNQLGSDTAAVPAAPGDGDVMMAVQVTDNGNGTWHYEYALLNQNSHRQIRSISLPVAGVANITNIGFHDNDQDPANDWQVTVDAGTITWQTETYDQNPNAPALVFGFMFNFRFDADAPPTNLVSTLGLFRPGTGTTVEVATTGPTNVAAGIDDRGAAAARVVEVRPNPFTRQTTIFYQAVSGRVDLSVYDAAGRLVRTLVDQDEAAGLRSVVWDGTGINGARVRSGAYYARLRAGSVTAVKPLVILD